MIGNFDRARRRTLKVNAQKNKVPGLESVYKFSK